MTDTGTFQSKLQKILITGGLGQLGLELKLLLGTRATVVGRSELDITETHAIEKIMNLNPDVVINCAALTDVDRCEEHPIEAELCHVKGTENVATACQRLGIPLVYVSTDYVFDGQKRAPYLETDIAHPVNRYGMTKLEGELIVRKILPSTHYIVRTGWLYGFQEESSKPNFLKRLLFLIANGKPLSFVTSQQGNPTSAYDLAYAIISLLGSRTYGTFHLANEGYCSRFELVGYVLKLVGRDDITVTPIDQYAQKAPRPAFTALENRRAAGLGIRLPTWQEGLDDFFLRMERYSSLLDPYLSVIRRN